MFYIREIRISDIPQVYEFTIRLLRHHIGQGSMGQNTQEGFLTLFTEGYLMGILLVESKLELNGAGLLEEHAEDRLIGCMLYHFDVSSLRGGHGVALDQFYIEPNYRRYGLGRQMMKMLSQKVLEFNGNYIKLVCQDGLGLDKVYGSMGFVNVTKDTPGLHVFEVYGKSTLAEFLQNTKELIKHQPSSSKTNLPGRTNSRNIFVTPLLPYGTMTHPNWTSVDLKTMIQVGRPPNVYSPIPAQLVIISGTNPYDDRIEDYHSWSTNPQSSLCMFIEQCVICSWLGPLVCFSDFVGDLSLLDEKLIIERTQAWTEQYSNICGAMFEVPCGVSKPNHPPSTPFHQPLIDALTYLGVADDTVREGWNIVYLSRDGMLKLIGDRKFTVQRSDQTPDSFLCVLTHQPTVRVCEE